MRFPRSEIGEIRSEPALQPLPGAFSTGPTGAGAVEKVVGNWCRSRFAAWSWGDSVPVPGRVSAALRVSCRWRRWERASLRLCSAGWLVPELEILALQHRSGLAEVIATDHHSLIRFSKDAGEDDWLEDWDEGDGVARVLIRAPASSGL